MKTGRFSSIITLAVALHCLLTSAAFAGFGFGGDDTGKSGLDFTKGYDVNTVTSVSGRVASSPQSGEKGHVFADINAHGVSVTLYLGPERFWEKNGLPLHPRDEVIAKGSLAQGKDGKSYLMVQKLFNRTTGAQMALRNEQGSPAWSGRNGGAMMWGRGGGMMDGGGMMGRGGGMMGGGMMRH
jgi:hypothetical protein